MFLRLLYQSFRRQLRRKILAGVAVALGVAVATAMIAVATDIGDKMNRELRSFGANIVVYAEEDALNVEIGGVNFKPASIGRYLKEADLAKIKTIFWRHNILGFAPFFSVREPNLSDGPRGKMVPVELIGTYFSKTLTIGKESFTTGVRKTHPWWRVEGEWPEDDSSDQVLAGRELAAQSGIKVGEKINFRGRKLHVVGILSSGGPEERALVAPLNLAQQIANQPEAVQRIYVSALTKPEDDFARRDPNSMSPEMRDRWYCSPYANSIAYQLAEVIPHSRAEQIRQVAQTEGAVLSRVRGLMLLITLAALIAAVLAVSAAMAAAILERQGEIALMRAIGARSAAIAGLFLAEAGVLALMGGVVGFLLGSLIARQVGLTIFNAEIILQPVLMPVVLLLACGVVFLGSVVPIRRAARSSPAVVLRGEA
jgi:putative ABC transport system permease protein